MIAVMPVLLSAAHLRKCSPQGRTRYAPSACAYRWTCQAHPHRPPWQALRFASPPARVLLIQQQRFFTLHTELPSAMESESGIFRLTAFRHIRFFLISADRHLAKVSAHILHPELRHPRLYQAEFSFIYEEFDLYRSLAIPVVWHKCYPIPVNLSLVRSEKLYSVCWILQFGLEEFRIHFNVLIE